MNNYKYDSTISNLSTNNTSEYLLEFNEQSCVTENFLKIPNSMFDLISGKKDNKPLLDPSEFVLYQYLYKLSYGWKKNYCRVGHDGLATALNMSLSTIKRMIKNIITKHCVIFIEENSISKLGSLYYVCNPEEILGHVHEFTRVKMSRVNLNPIKDIPKDIYKDTLSLDHIVDLFYNGIGHENITKRKRERAFSNCKELEQQGYTLDDIIYAVRWTLNNLKIKMYDFSIINETISQAIAVMKLEEINKQRRLQAEQAEEEKKRIEEESRRKLDEEFERFRQFIQAMPVSKSIALKLKAKENIPTYLELKDEENNPFLISQEINLLKTEPQWGYVAQT